MVSAAILVRAAEILAHLRRAGWMAATAESCTGGLIAASLTHVAGSSDVVDRGFVTYSNAAKTELLGVPAGLIDAAGAVSEAVAGRMALGALQRSRADITVSVTGVAGPGGGSPDKPVGLVWFGCARRGGGVQVLRRIFPGDRAAIRESAVLQALDLLGGT